MNTKILSNKLGIRPGPAKPDPNLEKLKKENAALKRSLDESNHAKGKMSDAERSKLLEKILELETLKEKNAQEIRSLKDALKSKLNENIVAAEQDARKVEKLAQNFRKQTAALIDSQGSTKEGENLSVLEGQLKDALEKNQQWLVYDQQRETYVQGLMGRIFELEQQLANFNQTLQQQAKEATSEGKQDEKQKYYDRLLLTAKKDLEGEKKLTAQLNAELSAVRVKYEEKKREAEGLSASLQSVRESERQQSEEEQRRMKDKMQRLKMELELYREKAEEEKNKSRELTNQIQVMQKSLLKYQEDQQRVSALEYQIQRCTEDFDNEKADRQKVQHQLHKVLKELRKAREQMAKLEPSKPLHDGCCIDPTANFHADFEDKLTFREQYPKHRNPLDESFLECPNCRAVYPTSQHRELLAHIDYCTR
ncbi:centrosomal protein of 55 kDa [Spea bombifrons]|uniref:centrosomal protein of 55 kDa n=1 Tax=Spea bombifrons TaxID=233779 RepID=UPI00234B586C|nr:centrosomal protein of 55 kDa [Spea bombifrons]